MRVGILALQGDFAAHRQSLMAYGVETIEVRTAGDLDGLDGLVLPGGESTTMLRLLDGNGLFGRLRKALVSGLPTLATCAGVILLAHEVTHPAQRSLGVLDATVERNAYGRQTDSRVQTLATEAASDLGVTELEGVFIRAPRIVRVGSEVAVLARLDRDPVLVRQNRLLAATFHPELSAVSPVMEMFVRSLGG